MGESMWGEDWEGFIAFGYGSLAALKEADSQEGCSLMSWQELEYVCTRNGSEMVEYQM